MVDAQRVTFLLFNAFEASIKTIRLVLERLHLVGLRCILLALGRRSIYRVSHIFDRVFLAAHIVFAIRIAPFSHFYDFISILLADQDLPSALRDVVDERYSVALDVVAA